MRVTFKLLQEAMNKELYDSLKTISKTIDEDYPNVNEKDRLQAFTAIAITVTHFTDGPVEMTDKASYGEMPIERFSHLVENDFLGLPIEEWFKYHPPETVEQQAKHDRVNNLALAAAKCIMYDSLDVEKYGSYYMTHLLNLIEHPKLKAWAEKNLPPSKQYSAFEAIMQIQQLRMIANQSITVLELRLEKIKEAKKLLREGPAVVVPEKHRSTHGPCIDYPKIAEYY